MGNSQSFEKVKRIFTECFRIYEEVQKEQNQAQHNNNQQQQYQQYQGHNNNQQQQHYNNNNNNNHGSSYHPSSDVDDDQQYSSLRAQAREAAEKRNACYAQSQEAYNSGDGARGKMSNFI